MNVFSDKEKICEGVDISSDVLDSGGGGRGFALTKGGGKGSEGGTSVGR